MLAAHDRVNIYDTRCKSLLLGAPSQSGGV
jgi:hypothetical protein